MKKDVRQLLKRFTQKGIKNGDLVFIGEICRVTDVNWGRKHGKAGDVEAINELPACECCSKEKVDCTHHRIVGRRGFGQQTIMKLVG